MPLTDSAPVSFLFTRDREKAKIFYRDVLGLCHKGSDEHVERFDLNGVALSIVPIADHAPSPHTVLGWDVPDIAASAATLQTRGVRFEIYDGFGQDENGIWTDVDGRAKMAWFLDPDGNNLCISEHKVD
jgi:catechol 2,3-dioxygenase-like lactoylglutathione lyase family enzyme